MTKDQTAISWNILIIDGETHIFVALTQALCNDY